MWTLFSMIIILSLTSPLTSLRCFEEMKYHEDYGYGYDIYCKKLNGTTIGELQNITVYNEIVLTVKASNLTISRKIFENITKVRKITFQNSDLHFDEKSNDTGFQGLKHVEILRINECNLSRLPVKVFFGLSNLNCLNLSDNHLSLIKNGTFRYLSGLKHLDLSVNNFANFTTFPICELPQLQNLVLKNNNLTVINQTLLNCLKLLNTLDLSHNRIQRVPNLNVLKYLTTIDLSYNHIADIETSFKDMPNLEILNLEGNLFTKLRDFPFSNLRALRVLNLKNNILSEIDVKVFNDLNKLEELDLESNLLEKISVHGLTSLNSLILSKNNVALTILDEISVLKNLRILKMASCNFRQVPERSFKNLNNLQLLDLSYNNIELKTLTFYGLYQLHTLILRGNSLYDLPDYVFNVAINLKQLDLSLNHIKSITNLTFYNLHNLEELNLSYNLMESMEESNLATLQNLKTLDLEANMLKIMDYNAIISFVPSLKLINIKGNKFSCQFLSQMINYLKTKFVSYTLSEATDFNRENVEGIKCKELQDGTLSEKRTQDLLVNDSKVLKKILNVTTLESEHLHQSVNVAAVIIGVIVILMLLPLVWIVYRATIVFKRRNYFFDDIELIDSINSHSVNYNKL